MVKRTFDVTASAIGLVVLLPLILGVSATVKLTSPGPVVFAQSRLGRHGRPFRMYKFRSMVVDADRRGARVTAGGDPRVTAVGRVLRRTKIDELPQLWNVLRGEMSIVGPRPLPQRDYDQLEDWHRKRYLVLPGMTGLWQVSGRSDLDFDDLVRLDFVYIERWSLSLDLSIILQTIPAVIRRRGAF